MSCLARPSSSAHVGGCVCCSYCFLYSLKFARVSFLCFDSLVQQCRIVIGEGAVVGIVIVQCTPPARWPPCSCCDRAMSWLLRRWSLFQVSLNSVCNVTVRVALTRNTEDTCSDPVSAAFSSRRNPRNTSAMIPLVSGSSFLGVHADLTACKARSCRFDSSAMLCCIDC